MTLPSSVNDNIHYFDHINEVVYCGVVWWLLILSWPNAQYLVELNSGRLWLCTMANAKVTDEVSCSWMVPFAWADGQVTSLAAVHVSL